MGSRPASAASPPSRWCRSSRGRSSLATEKINVTCFQDTNRVYIPGMRDISGTLTGFWNSDDMSLIEATALTTPGCLELIPHSNDPSAATPHNFSGLAYMDAELDTDVEGAPGAVGHVHGGRAVDAADGGDDEHARRCAPRDATENRDRDPRGVTGTVPGLFHSVTFGGQRGAIVWGAGEAAVLGRWSVSRDEHFHWTLSARVERVDTLPHSAAPADLPGAAPRQARRAVVLPRAAENVAGEWRRLDRESRPAGRTLMDIVVPREVTLPLTNGRSVTVWAELNHGQYIAMLSRMFTESKDGELRRDVLKTTDATVIAYLIDWTLTDAAGPAHRGARPAARRGAGRPEQPAPGRGARGQAGDRSASRDASRPRARR